MTNEEIFKNVMDHDPNKNIDVKGSFSWNDINRLMNAAKIDVLTTVALGIDNQHKDTESEEDYQVQHLINDTYQVVGKESGIVWKQGTMEECVEWTAL